MAGGGALFVGLMVLGDGEESLPDVVELLEKARDRGWTRKELLYAARRIPGVYVPSLFTPVSARPARLCAPLWRILPARHDVLWQTSIRPPIPCGRWCPWAVHNRLSL